MEKVIVKASNKTTGKEKYDLYIGRWQPWHNGHQWLVDQSLKKGKCICIAIRDVEIDHKNPWKPAEIFNILSKRFEKEINEGKVKLVIIPDIDSINIGRDVGYDIIEHVPTDEIAQISATKIREEIKKNNIENN
jgi:adenylylsulfate kinase